MKKRSYSQFCAIARALDLVGERWTLLLLRELLAGPRRYSDLLQGLPGIGTNLLASRLQELEAEGLIERSVLPPPAASHVYALTARGRALRGVIMGLGAWGAELTGAPEKGDKTRAWWSLLLLNGRFFRPGAKVPPTLTEAYEVRAGGEVFQVKIAEGKLDMAQGAAHSPAFVLVMEAEMLASVVAGKAEIGALLASGRASFEGDAKALKRFEKIFDLGAPEARR